MKNRSGIDIIVCLLYNLRKKVITQIQNLKNAQDKIGRSLKNSQKVTNIGAAISSFTMYYGFGKMIYSAWFSEFNTTGLLIVAGASAVFTPIVLRHSRLEKDLNNCLSLLDEANLCNLDKNYSVSDELIQNIEMIVSKYK